MLTLLHFNCNLQAQESRLSTTFSHYVSSHNIILRLLFEQNIIVGLQKHTSFQYATGAAYCISSFLMDKLEPYCRLVFTQINVLLMLATLYCYIFTALRGAILAENCDSMGYPDDVLIGAVIGICMLCNYILHCLCSLLWL